MKNKKSLKKLLLQQISELRPKLNQEIQDTIDDLLPRLTGIHSVESMFCVSVFKGNDCSVAVGVLSKNDLADLDEEKQELLNSQFRTHAEDALYCEGTKYLLGLLTQYRYIEKDDSLIIASPDSWIWCDDRAYITREEITEQMRPTRSVQILLVCKEHAVAIAFNFEETVKFK